MHYTAVTSSLIGEFPTGESLQFILGSYLSVFFCFSLGYIVFLACFLVVVSSWLSVTVQVIDWKDLSPIVCSFRYMVTDGHTHYTGMINCRMSTVL